MKQHTFEIKVALLGHVSAGKSTVLNALLRDKFSEVAMRRTTAGVNFFRLHPKHRRGNKDTSETKVAHDEMAGNEVNTDAWEFEDDTESWDVGPDKVHDADSTLDQIAKDNAILRHSHQIQESKFDVELDEPLCDMRDDTKLVLIDIPGLNEAGSKELYRNHVNEQWDTFDCVVVVLDVKQDVNTEEQVQLLRQIKENLETKKNVPVIVLCNKVDDPDNEEVRMLVEEVHGKVKEVFGAVVVSHAAALQDEDPASGTSADGTSGSSPSGSPARVATTAFGSSGGFASGSSGGFVFGSSGGLSSGSAPAMTSGFTFGSGSVAPSSSAAPFIFGPSHPFVSSEFRSSPSEPSTSASQSPFATVAPFGSSSVPIQSSNAPITFGTSATTHSGFVFGATTSIKLPVPVTAEGLTTTSNGAAPSAPAVGAAQIGATCALHVVHFIPVSAENAFVYRTVARLDFDSFKTKLNTDLIEKIGCNEVGIAKWRGLSHEKKLKAAYSAVSHAAYKHSFEATNFDAFLRALNCCVGGNKIQLLLIEAQLQIAMSKLCSFKMVIAKELRMIAEMQKALSKVPVSYERFFWDAYDVGLTKCVEAFKSEMDVAALQKAMSQLIEYGSFIKSIGNSIVEKRKITEAMAALVRVQVGVLYQHVKSFDGTTKARPSLLYDWDESINCWRLDLPRCSECIEGTRCQNRSHFMLHPHAGTMDETDWFSTRDPLAGIIWRSYHGREDKSGVEYSDTTRPPRSNAHHWERIGDSDEWRNKYTSAVSKSAHNPVSGEISWGSLTQRDVYLISYSILLSASQRSFCERFGQEKVLLEQIVQDYLSLKQSRCCATIGHLSLARDILSINAGGSYIDLGIKEPTNPETGKLTDCVMFPDELSDPKHWGHLAWQYCKFTSSDLKTRHSLHSSSPGSTTIEKTKFEVKVAILGNVGAGKSTVINALLRDKFTEVTMRRTTAGVSNFRLHSKLPATASDVRATLSDSTTLVRHTAADTLQAITYNNAAMRQSKSIQESSFDVTLDEPLCEMRDDTNLILIDIPGLNEAGSKELYRDFISRKWDTFDCVIVVIDVHQGVNSEKQVELLEQVKQNLATKKDMPVIVLCNKVDYPVSQEVDLLVNEVREKVETVFRTSVTGTANTSIPTFLPVSAETWFVSRTVSKLDYQNFAKLDKSVVEKIGRDWVGQATWRRLSPDERYTAAYNAVVSPDYLKSVESTNFDNFMRAFNRCVGGTEVQLSLIDKQLSMTFLESLSFDKVIAVELKKIADMRRVLMQKPVPYSGYFWSAYSLGSKQCFESFNKCMDNSKLLQAMTQLIEYSSFARSQGSHADQSKTIAALAALVRLQINMVLQKCKSVDEWATQQRGFQYVWCRQSGCWGLNGSNKLHPQADTIDEAEWVWSCHPAYRMHMWNNECTGAWVDGVVYKDATKPPRTLAQHWVRCTEERNQWCHEYTNAKISSKYNPVSGPFGSLSPRDLYVICSSVLLLSSRDSFCEHFGREKMLLERIVHDYLHLMQQLDPGYNTRVGKALDPQMKIVYQRLWVPMQGAYADDGTFVPKDPKGYADVAQIEMPSDVSNPDHWGHLAWKFCEFIDTLPLSSSE